MTHADLAELRDPLALRVPEALDRQAGKLRGLADALRPEPRCSSCGHKASDHEGRCLHFGGDFQRDTICGCLGWSE